MSSVLIPESVLEPLDPVVLDRYRKEAHRFAMDPKDPVFGRELRRVTLLEDFPDILEQAGIRPSSESRFYTNFYWSRRLAKVYAAACGHEDAGLEQQWMKVIENAMCDYDVEILEELDNMIDREISQSRSEGSGPVAGRVAG